MLPSRAPDLRQLASVLHDEVCQALAVAQMKVAMARQHCADASRPARDLDDALNLLERAAANTRQLMSGAMGAAAQDGDELAVHVNSLLEIFQRDYKLAVVVDDDGQPKALEPVACAALCRGVRELLINVVKHARTSSARLHLCCEGANVSAMVEDDGVGFDPLMLLRPDPNRLGGFGLLDVIAGIRCVGGEAQIDSAPGRGARVKLTVPCGRGLGA